MAVARRRIGGVRALTSRATTIPPMMPQTIAASSGTFQTPVVVSLYRTNIAATGASFFVTFSGIVRLECWIPLQIDVTSSRLYMPRTNADGTTLVPADDTEIATITAATPDAT